MAFRIFFTVRSLLRLAFVVSLLAIFTTASPAQFTEGDFNPVVNGAFIKVIALQTNAQVLIGGDFTSVDGSPRSRIARLNSDGTLDTTFNPGADAPIAVLAVQPNGRILVGGSFNQLAGESHTNVGRLNTDGTHDDTFQCWPDGTVSAFALCPDGKILIGGSFGSVNGQTHRGIARLLSNGTVDATFTADVSGRVLVVAQQTNGDVIVAGNFGTLNGQSRDSMGRLHSDGSLDTAFYPAMSHYGVTGPVVESLALQPDGKILVGGDFEDLGGVPLWCYFGRLNADGSLDPWFAADTDEDVEAIAIQADGKIVIGGEFDLVGDTYQQNFARVNPDGTVDKTFAPGVNDDVWALVVQPDTKILVGGIFSTLGGAQRTLMGRLYPDGTLDGEYRAFRPQLENVKPLSDGARQLSFANPGLHAFTVLACANLSLPASNWTALGVATNAGDGLFKFVDSGATNFTHRFYQLRWP